MSEENISRTLMKECGCYVRTEGVKCPCETCLIRNEDVGLCLDCCLFREWLEARTHDEHDLEETCA